MYEKHVCYKFLKIQTHCKQIDHVGKSNTYTFDY